MDFILTCGEINSCSYSVIIVIIKLIIIVVIILVFTFDSKFLKAGGAE